jgi:predicted nucleic acid-binding protein
VRRWELASRRLLCGLSLILSEDFNPGAVMEGVRFANPFAAGFDWVALGLDAV